MKILLKFCSRLALTGLAFAFPAFLQAASDTPAPAPAPTAGEQAKAAVPFDLEIRNGSILENNKEVSPATIGNVMDYLKKKNLPFDIILGPGVADVRISDLVMHSPEYEEWFVLNAIGASVGDDVETSRDSGMPMMKLRQSQQVRQTQVFNLTNYLNPDGKADDKSVHEKLSSLIDVIQKTLSDLDHNTPPNLQPNFQFHEGANLLVVIGPTDAIDVANQVVNALQPPDGNPSNQLQPFRLRFGTNDAETDPAAATAWMQSLPGVDPDSIKKYQEALNLFDSLLQAGPPNNAMSMKQLADLQRKISDLMKQIQDTQIQQNLQHSPRDLPDKTTSP